MTQLNIAQITKARIRLHLAQSVCHQLITRFFEDAILLLSSNNLGFYPNAQPRY